MKSRCSLIATALALAGCIPDPGEAAFSIRASDSDIPVIPTDIATAGLLGQGRNVVTEELRGDCVRSATTLTIPLQESSLRFGSSLLKEEASEMLGYSVDAKARYKLVSGSARAKFSRSLTQNSLSLGMFYVADYLMGIERLDQGSLQWLVPPGSADWLNRCGDHFLHQRERGGQLYLLYRIDFGSLAARQEFEGAVGVSFPAGEVNGSVTRQSSRFVNRASVHVEAFQVGGDVTRLSSILGGGGPDANAGRVVIECNMANLAPCGTFMQNAINYASAQTAGSFSDTLRASPADRTYLFKDWSLLGVAIPTRTVPAAVKSARFALRQLFDGQVEVADRIAVLKGGTLYVPAALRAQLDGYAQVAQRNLAILGDAVAQCYDQITDPASATQVAACSDAATAGALAAQGYDASLTIAKLAVDIRLPYVFGGMYQATLPGYTPHNVVNPFTNALSCPAGFTAYVYGRSLATISTVSNHVVCLAPDTVPGGGWEFTGAFEINDGGATLVANGFAASATASCPAGTGLDYTHGSVMSATTPVTSGWLRFCSTGVRSNARTTIGGMFQKPDNCGDTIPNPLTGAPTCPEGFVAQRFSQVRSPTSFSCTMSHYVCKAP